MSSITQAGRDLLAMSTALDRLVFSKAYMLTASYSDAALSSMTTMPDVSTAPVGAIKNVVFINGKCRATTEFSGGGNANFATVIIAARLESQSDAQSIPFCGFNDGDIYSPPSGGLNTYIDIDFYLSFLDNSATVSVTTAAAAPVSYVDALRNDVYNGAKSPCRVYKNFLEAQCHAMEGESAFIEPTGPDVFYIKIPTYPSTGSFSKHKISDFCDHILAIVIHDSSYTYVEFYDMRDATIDGQEITLPAPFVRAQLGDESSTAAVVKIAKIDDMYFAIAYNNCSSSNQWWYNSTVGQSSSEKIVGNCAAMPLDAYTVPYGGSTIQLTKGRWYGVGSTTGCAMRGIGRDLVIYTSTAKSTDTCYLSRIKAELTISGGVYVIFTRTDLQIMEYAYIDEMYVSGGTFLDMCAATTMADGVEIVLIAWYNADISDNYYTGSMIRDRTVVQELKSMPMINDTFYAPYDISAVDINSKIASAEDFATPGGTCLVCKSESGLWCSIYGYWNPFNDALSATVTSGADIMAPDSPLNIYINGKKLSDMTGNLSIDLWGMEHGPIVKTEFLSPIKDGMLKIGSNICAGTGLVCGWAVSSATRLFIMYVKNSSFFGNYITTKKDGMI